MEGHSGGGPIMNDRHEHEARRRDIAPRRRTDAPECGVDLAGYLATRITRIRPMARRLDRITAHRTGRLLPALRRRGAIQAIRFG